MVTGSDQESVSFESIDPGKSDLVLLDIWRVEEAGGNDSSILDYASN